MTQRQRILTVWLLLLTCLAFSSCLVRNNEPPRSELDPNMVNPNDPIVYVGTFGNTYHTKTCTLIRLDRYPMPLSEAKRFYRPCKQCKPVE